MTEHITYVVWIWRGEDVCFVSHGSQQLRQTRVRAWLPRLQQCQIRSVNIECMRILRSPAPHTTSHRYGGACAASQLLWLTRAIFLNFCDRANKAQRKAFRKALIQQLLEKNSFIPTWLRFDIVLSPPFLTLTSPLLQQKTQWAHSKTVEVEITTG